MISYDPKQSAAIVQALETHDGGEIPVCGEWRLRHDRSDQR